MGKTLIGVQNVFVARLLATKIISMIQWIRTSRLSIKNSLFLYVQVPITTANSHLRKSEQG